MSAQTDLEQARARAEAARTAAVAASATVKRGTPDRAEALRNHENWIAACALANHLEREHAALVAAAPDGYYGDGDTFGTEIGVPS